MKLKLQSKDLLLIAVLAAFILGIIGVSHVVFGESSWGISATFVGGVVVILLLEERRRAQNRQEEALKTLGDTYSQIEALLSVRSEVDVHEAFPATRGWAASPDYLRELIRLIREHDPQQILEAGSGVSTVIAALALQKYGDGQIIALENGEEFADNTRRYLQLHGVQSNATVVHAPLKKHSVDGRECAWYEMAATEGKQIDLLVIDGPPALEESEARWPALPLLWDQLNPGARILMDDGDREGERRVIEDWSKRYPIQKTYLPLEEGAYLLERIQ
jgi:predicted O-methyltransferase YrrM